MDTYTAQAQEAGSDTHKRPVEFTNTPSAVVTDTTDTVPLHQSEQEAPQAQQVARVLEERHSGSTSAGTDDIEVRDEAGGNSVSLSPNRLSLESSSHLSSQDTTVSDSEDSEAGQSPEAAAENNQH